MILNNTKSEHVQYQIAEYITTHLTSPITGITDQLLQTQCYSLFKNFRLVNQLPTGLRLTATGHKLLSKHFTATEFHLADPIVGIVLVNLDQAMTQPYYLSKKTVAFYNEQDAAWFKLGGSNLSYFAGNL